MSRYTLSSDAIFSPHISKTGGASRTLVVAVVSQCLLLRWCMNDSRTDGGRAFFTAVDVRMSRIYALLHITASPTDFTHLSYRAHTPRCFFLEDPPHFCRNNSAEHSAIKPSRRAFGRASLLLQVYSCAKDTDPICGQFKAATYVQLKNKTMNTEIFQPSCIVHHIYFDLLTSSLTFQHSCNISVT